jgi:mannose-6-phosphate isomerase
VVSAARHEATREGHYQPGQLDTYQLLVELAQRYPADVGVVVAALLNRVRLRPGEAVWMPAGNLHAYLCGVGIELMAASDNVLRGGLTPKHVNVPELLRVLRFEVLADPVVKAEQVSPGVVTWPVPVPDFALHRAVLTDRQAQLPGSGPRILLCRQGTAKCRTSPRETLVLRAGQAAFVPASAGPVVVDPVGGAEIFQASL